MLAGATSDLFALAQAACALGLLAALVWLVRRMRYGSPLTKNRALAVEERLPIDMRNGLVIVRAEGKRLLLSVSDHGAPRLLMELPTPPEEPRA